MDAKRRFKHCFPWSLVLIAFLGGCAFTIAPVLKSDSVYIPVRDQWPFRVAVLYPVEEQRKNYSFSIRPPLGDSYHGELPLGSTVESVLAKSLPRLFASVTVTQVQPPADAYEVVLVPRLGDTKLELIGEDLTGRVKGNLRFAIRGSMRVLDRSGAQIALINAETEESERFQNGTQETTEQTGRLASRALANLVKRWGEELIVSRELQQYAMRIRPDATAKRAAAPASPPTPTTSRAADTELTIAIGYPTADSRLSQPSVLLVATIKGRVPLTAVDVSVNGQPVALAQRVEGAVMPLSQQIPLTSGENVIVVTAHDRSGGVGQKVIRVFRESRQAASQTPETSSGSGVLLRNTNLILTNYHVVRDKSQLTVKFPNGEEYQGRVAFRDSGNDLALVEVKGLRPTPRGAVIAVGTEPRIGETVHALGYPLGAGLSRSPSMVSGAISSTVGVEDDIARFRTTAPINPGNSGGPIVNERGQIIGIAVAGLVREGIEAIRFGIKASTAALILQQAQVTTSFDVAVTPTAPRPPDEIFSRLSPHVVLIETR